MTEELMSYLQDHPEYFYLIRDKQLIAIIRSLSKGGKRLVEIAEEFKLQPKKAKLIMDDLKKKKAVTTMMTQAGEVYILDFNGQKMLDLLEKAKEI